MLLKGLRHLSRTLWLVAAFCLLLTALLVSVGRYYLPLVANYSEPLARELTQRLGIQVRIGALNGEWRALGPVLAVERFELLPDPSRPPAVMLERAELSFDLIGSALARAPRFSQLHAEGVMVSLEQTAEGRWRLQGRESQSPPPSLDQLLPMLGWVDEAQISRTVLQLLPHQRPARAVQLSELALLNDFGLTHLRAEAMLPGGREPLSLRAEVEQARNGPALRAYAGFANMRFDGLEWATWDARGEGLGGRVWLDWQRSQGLHLQAELTADQLQYRQGERLWQWQGPALQLQLRSPSGGGLEADLALAPSQPLGVAWPATRAQLSSPDLKQWRLWLDQLSAPAVNEALLQSGLLTPKLSDMFRTMALQGQLRDVWLDFPLHDARKFNLQATLEQVGLSPHRGIPGGTGISGFLQADAKGGRVELASDGFSMFFPGVYRQPLAFARADGVVRWHLFPHHAVVESGVLALEGEDGHARGLLRLSLPYAHDYGPAEMELAIGLRDSDASRRNKFIPYILSEDLRRWLDESIRKGHVRDSAFWFRGSLEHGGSRTTQLFFDVQGGELQYHKDWPAITELDGLVVIDDVDILAEPRQAKVYGSALQQARVRVQARDGVVVDVDTGLQGDAADILRLINESPVRRQVGDGLAEWQASGAVSSRIKLHLPIKSGELGRDAEISVESQLVDSKLDMVPLRLPIEKLNGVLQFDLKQGLSAQMLLGQLWQRPVQAQLRTQKGELQLEAQARVSGADGSRWLGLPAFAKLSGESEYRVKLRQPSGARRSIEVESSLAGTAIELPQPFGKPSAERRPVKVRVNSEGEQQRLVIEHAAIDARLQLKQWALQGGGIGLGSAAPAAGDRVLISGRLPDFAYAQWQAVFKSANAASPGAEGQGASAADWRSRVRVSGLVIDRLDVGALVLPNAKVDAERDRDAWRLRLSSAPLAGSLRLADDATQPLALSLDYLRLEPPAPPPPPGVIPPDPWRDMDPATLPAADVELREFKRGELDYGQWRLRLRPMPGGTRIEGLHGSARGLAVTGLHGEGDASLEWQRMADGSHLTRMRSRFGADNLGDVLEAWQYGRSVESQRAHFDLDAHWPASPAGSRLAIMSGDLGIDIQQGRFLQVSGGTNALRVMGLLNFHAVLRRLRLDFSDMYGKGLSFDSVKGGLALQAGQASFSPLLQVNCPSSQFQLSANLDLVREQIDGQMQVTLPLSGNLPWVAGLVAGLPVAAGVFVASKLFEHQVNVLSSAVYSVNGPWAEPKVEFRQAFNTSPRAPAEEKKNAPPPSQPADAQRPGARPQP